MPQNKSARTAVEIVYSLDHTKIQKAKKTMRNTNIIQTLILTLTLTQTLEMGRMSADDLGRLTEQLLNVQPNFDRMLYARMKRNLLLVSTLRGQETCEHARIV